MKDLRIAVVTEVMKQNGTMNRRVCEIARNTMVEEMVDFRVPYSQERLEEIVKILLT